MKAVYAVALCALCTACFPSRELQAELVNATLIKVEEIRRYPDIKQKVLTWQIEKSVSFVTYEPASVDIPIGTHTKVLVQK